MLFSDEPRFSSSLVPAADGQIAGHTKSPTNPHVGPGVYLSEQFEERRSGWKKQSFTHRQPMSGPTANRQDYYTSSVIAKNGTMSSPSRSKSPGPGAYDNTPSIFSFPTDPHRTKDLNLSALGTSAVHNQSTRNTTMCSTPRFAHSGSACLHSGVVFQSGSNDRSDLGPGSYAVPRDELLKRSYNVRVRSNSVTSTPRPNSRPSSRSGTPNGSPRPGTSSAASPANSAPTTPRAVSRGRVSLGSGSMGGSK
eukprot:CAMPEP_0173298788 /NCGR_PEP_ID=MMETSP1143-20121109/16291_1 /TAXON_ID=483371 /ORGANISM="non described non described, Strain CCMP2298" /LENGTH=250 /DNA_ID=CAMNT_0014238951 /DNA_START=157 /DNA_END=912 /DNA_ORIENTATION=-